MLIGLRSSLTGMPSSLPLQARKIWVHSLKTGERRLLVERGSHARYVSSGHLVYASEGSLMAAPFDAERLELIGPAVPVIEGVMMARPREPALGHFAVSASGSLAYLAGPVLNSKQTLHWVDRQGREESLNVEPRSYLWPRISPDGTRVAVEVVQSGNRDVWIYDLVRKTFGVGSRSIPLMMGDPCGRPTVIESSSGQLAIEEGSTCSGSGSMALAKPNASPASQTGIGPHGVSLRMRRCSFSLRSILIPGSIYICCRWSAVIVQSRCFRSAFSKAVQGYRAMAAGSLIAPTRRGLGNLCAAFPQRRRRKMADHDQWRNGTSLGA